MNTSICTYCNTMAKLLLDELDVSCHGSKLKSYPTLVLGLFENSFSIIAAHFENFQILG